MAHVIRFLSQFFILAANAFVRQIRTRVNIWDTKANMKKILPFSLIHAFHSIFLSWLSQNTSVNVFTQWFDGIVNFEAINVKYPGSASWPARK
jgi:hypothetical protein